MSDRASVKMSQREAAVEGVRKIGLRQKREVDPGRSVTGNRKQKCSRRVWMY